MADEAAEELARKVRGQASLKKQLRALHREIVVEFERHVAVSAAPFDAAARIGDTLERTLNSHYGRVTDRFGKSMNRKLARAVKATEDERALIDDALASFADDRAPGQAARINKTTQQAMDDAIRLAEAESDALFVQEGQGLTRAERAKIARRKVEKNLRGRIDGIATLETQAPAEAAKLTEVEVLMGEKPSVLSDGKQPASIAVPKTWLSQGGSDVRDTHLIADSQKVPTNEPFTVGGASLMYPGDGTLGAPVKELAGCQCTASYDAGAVAAARGG